MPRSRFRFTVRWLIVAVAIVAVVLGVGLQVRKWYLNFREFTELASRHSRAGAFSLECVERHTRWAAEWRAIAEEFPGQRTASFAQMAEREATAAEKWRLMAEYCARMKGKYAAAARRPWRVVEPDPPEPELP